MSHLLVESTKDPSQGKKQIPFSIGDNLLVSLLVCMYAVCQSELLYGYLKKKKKKSSAVGKKKGCVTERWSLQRGENDHQKEWYELTEGKRGEGIENGTKNQPFVQGEVL